LHLAVADVGNDAVALFINTDAVGHAAEIAPEAGATVFLNPRASAAAVSGVNTAVIQSNHALRAHQTITDCFYAADIDFHFYIWLAADGIIRP